MGAIFAAWPLNIPPHQWGCTACHGMSIGRKAVIQAAHVMADTGLDLMTEPRLLQAAKDEFAKRTAGKPYKSLNVEAVPPGGQLNLRERDSYDCVIHSAMEYMETTKAASGTRSNGSI